MTHRSVFTLFPRSVAPAPVDGTILIARDARAASPKLASRAGRPTGTTAKRPFFPRPSWLTLVLILLANYLIITQFLPEPPPRLDVPYSLFRQQVEAGNVAEVVSRGDVIQGVYKAPVTYPVEGEQARTSRDFTTVRPSFGDLGLEGLLLQQGVTINARPLDEGRGWWFNALLSFGPALLLIGAFVWLSRRAARGGPAFGLGRSGARRYDGAAVDTLRVTFSDVAGIEEVERELVEIVDFLKDPAKYTRLGGAAPKGVLLVGSPGTGKTLLARAVAGEAEVPFFSMGASEFIEMIVGVGASRVRDLFKQAREAAPAIIFIDELDAIGRARGSAVMGGGHAEQEQTLNQLLTEMDGFSSREGVIVLAATNRPDVLDAALLRAGRFDRQVVVHPPDKLGREAILTVHTREVPLAFDVNLAQIAASTPGLVGADLKNLVNEAALLAARGDAAAVHHSDFLDAIEKLMLGPARNLVLSHEERERVAYHEGGHTITGLVLPGADPVQRVTITPRGRALGVTYQRPDDDRHNYDEAYLRARIVVALGGRAAEQAVYGTRTTGAEDDMEQAASLARQMVTRWGMSDAFGPLSLAPRNGGFLHNGDGLGPARVFSDDTARRIDAEVQQIITESYAQAMRILDEHRPALDALAVALLESETLSEQAIHQVTGLAKASTLRVAEQARVRQKQQQKKVSSVAAAKLDDGPTESSAPRETGERRPALPEQAVAY